MFFSDHSALLYAVTDRAWLCGETLAFQVEQALRGGATCVQLREKELPEAAFLAEALELKTLCARFKVPFLVNDNIEVAIASGADGVHIGQQDMAAVQARQKIGNKKILGVSVQTAGQAIAAVAAGADYLGVGTVFPTSTKLDAQGVSFAELQKICSCVPVPVVAIGGICRENVLQLKGSGISGIAVVSALFAQDDIRAAASALRSLVSETVAG